MKTNAGSWCLATVIAAAGCSGDPAGETIGSAQQALGAGEFALLNEVELNPPGGDAPWQYIELVGTPGALLSGLQLVVAEGLGAASVQMVVNLGAACGGPCAIGTNGIFMIKAADSGAGPQGHTPPAGTAVFKDAQLSAATLTTADTAVLLVQGPAPIAEGASLARGDGGVAILPAGDSILDGVGWGGGGTLAGVTLTQAAGIPDAATRLRGRTDRTASAWYGGNLAGLASTVNYAAPAAQRTANFPAGGVLTPGAPNLPLEEDAGADGGDAAIDAAADAVDATNVTPDAVPEADAASQVDAAPDAVADQAADVAADRGPDGSPSDVGFGFETFDRIDAAPDAVADQRTDDMAEVSVSDALVDGAPPGTDGAAGSGGAGGTGGTAGSGGSAGSGGTAGTGGTAGSGGRATGGSAGTGGRATGGSAGTGGTAGSADAGGEAPPAGDDGGCGCHVGSAPVGGRGALFALFGLTAFLRTRRKQRRVS